MRNQVMEMLNKKEVELAIDNTMIDNLINRGEERGYTKRKIFNRIIKANKRYLDGKNQKEVSELTITILWYNSNTWGKCARAKGDVLYSDGREGVTREYCADGCGYDKESSLIADIFNEVLLYKLYDKNLEGKKTPYGISLVDGKHPTYSKGAGVSCYYNIVDFLEGKLEQISSGDRHSVYRVTLQ